MRSGVFTGLLLAACLAASAGRADEPARVMPEELADEPALARLAEARASLPVFGALRFEQQSSDDRSDGEHYALKLLRRGNRDMSNFVCRSDDAHFGVSYPKPRYDQKKCPEPWVHGIVLARFTGAGALSRLWLATKLIADKLPDKARFRIYRDASHEPLVDVPLRELLDGSNALFAAPWGMGQKTQVGWYYPVTFSDGLILAIDEIPKLDAVWFQAQVTRDGPHESAKDALLKARDGAAHALREPLAAGSKLERKEVKALAPQGTATLFDLRGPATIQALTFSAANIAVLDTLRVQIRWNAEAEPAVDLPARELFGAALAAPSVDSEWLAAQSSSESVSLTLGLPMPFAARAQITLINEGSSEVSLSASLALQSGTPRGAFGTLHAQRNETRGPTKSPTHPLGHAAGRGRVVGLCAALEGHPSHDLVLSDPLNLLEGDPDYKVDDVTLHGTGTEDIFDSIFYFQNAPITTPFVQAWDIEKKKDHGRASACRWFTHGTELDFQNAFDATLEIGAGKPGLLDRYRTVLFLYQ